MKRFRRAAALLLAVLCAAALLAGCGGELPGYDVPDVYVCRAG